jgi:protoporphyrinogen oxidase
MPPRLISPKFAAKKIQRLDIKKIISKILGGKGEEHEIYWEELLYPEKGSGELFHKMADQFKARGGMLHLKANVVELERDAERIKTVKFEKDGKMHVVDADYVISSLPIRNMILMIKPSFGDYISYTAKRLRFRGMIFVYLVLDTERVSEAHWIYLLDPVFKFNRVTEQKNLSAACCPPGKTVLCFELCAGTNEDIWTYADEQLKELVMDEIQKIKVIDPALISDFFVRRKEDAYAICHIDFDKQLKDLLEHLSNIQNLLTTGRQGLYNQIDMHDSMVLGLSAARFFMEGHSNRLGWYKEKTAHLDWDR